MERLRAAAREERVPEELMHATDLDLLGSIGVLKNGRLTRAGLLIGGSEAAIQKHVPGFVASHLRMRSETEYTDVLHLREAILSTLARLTDRINADNPVTTVQSGLYHFEYRTWPEIAVREALMNALCHADFRLAGPILVKQYADRLTISNPGGFIGGISPANILHHQPVARNPHLVDALTRLRLVNRSNLGVSRMFQELLIHGKEPPILEEQGEAVKVTFLSGPLSSSFGHGCRRKVSLAGFSPWTTCCSSVICYGIARSNLATGAGVCQRSELEIRELLNEMEVVRQCLQRGGAGRGLYYSLRPALHKRIAAEGHPERNRRIDWEAAKTRILSVLKHRAERGEKGLTNSEIRGITHFDSRQVKRLMAELKTDGQAQVAGKTSGAVWVYVRP